MSSLLAWDRMSEQEIRILLFFHVILAGTSGNAPQRWTDELPVRKKKRREMLD